MPRYVVELGVQAPVFGPDRARDVLPTPDHYGCDRGFWIVEYAADSLGTKRPAGILLTVGLQAASTEEAEDKGLTTGLKFCEVVSAHFGSPLAVPRLRRLARVGIGDGLLEQNDYYYLDGSDEIPRVFIRPYRFNQMLEWFGYLQQPIAEAAELAARWYGMSLGAQDPLDGYLAAWIGLESIDAPLARRVHLHGPKAPCATCHNVTGQGRNEGLAAIDHALRHVAPELFDGRVVKDFENIRHAIAHGLEPAPILRQRASAHLADIQLGLIFAILTVIRPDDLLPGAGRAILPREFAPFPDAVNTVSLAVEATDYRPWVGDWLRVERTFLDTTSRVEADGQYAWGARTRVQVLRDPDRGLPTITSYYKMFQRRGRNWQNLEPGATQIEVVPWRERPISAAWQRTLATPEENP